MAPPHLVLAMPHFRNLATLHFARYTIKTADSSMLFPTAWLAPLALLTVVASSAVAQGSGASGTPLHLPANSFEFVASGETQPLTKPLRVHNGGTAPFTDVRLTRLAYADSASGSKWLVAVQRQSGVAPDELATVGMLCVDPTGLEAGTYRAKAAVSAREVPEPVGITITLVVTEAASRTRPASARCITTGTK